MKPAEERISSPVVPLSAMLGATLSIALGSSLAKFQLFPEVGAEGATALRGVFAALLLIAFIRPWRFRPNRRELLSFAIFGGTIGIMNLLFYMALRTIPFGIAVAIEFTGPLAVTVLSSRRPLDFLWIALAAVGLVLLLPISDGAERLDPVGIAFALGAAFCWAIYIIVGKRLSSGNGIQAVAFAMIFAAVVTVPFGLAHAGASLFSWHALGLGLLVGALSSSIPYTLEIVALKHIPRKVFGLLLSMEPAVSALAGMAILSEFLTMAQWLAVACVAVASAGSAYMAR